jgi:hypothetical protein
MNKWCIRCGIKKVYVFDGKLAALRQLTMRPADDEHSPNPTLHLHCCNVLADARKYVAMTLKDERSSVRCINPIMERVCATASTTRRFIHNAAEGMPFASFLVVLKIDNDVLIEQMENASVVGRNRITGNEHYTISMSNKMYQLAQKALVTNRPALGLRYKIGMGGSPRWQRQYIVPDAYVKKVAREVDLWLVESHNFMGDDCGSTHSWLKKLHWLSGDQRELCNLYKVQIYRRVT